MNPARAPDVRGPASLPVPRSGRVCRLYECMNPASPTPAASRPPAPAAPIAAARDQRPGLLRVSVASLNDTRATARTPGFAGDMAGDRTFACRAPCFIQDPVTAQSTRLPIACVHVCAHKALSTVSDHDCLAPTEPPREELVGTRHGVHTKVHLLDVAPVSPTDGTRPTRTLMSALRRTATEDQSHRTCESAISRDDGMFPPKQRAI